MKIVYRSSAALAVALAASACAGMASAADLVVEFSAAAPVPLSPWMTALLTIGIVGIVVAMLSRRKALGGTMAGLALLASASLFAVEKAQAAPPNQLQLSTSSPATYENLASASEVVTVTNGNATAVTLNSIAVTGLGSGYYSIANTGCQVGGVLEPAQSCNVSINYNPPV